MQIQQLNPPLLNPFGVNKVSGIGFSPFGGPVPLGGFGAPYVIEVKPPKFGLFMPTGPSSTETSITPFQSAAPASGAGAESSGPPAGTPAAIQPFAAPAGGVDIRV
jgi:hypothetical protein